MIISPVVSMAAGRYKFGEGNDRWDTNYIQDTLTKDDQTYNCYVYWNYTQGYSPSPDQSATLGGFYSEYQGSGKYYYYYVRSAYLLGDVVLPSIFHGVVPIRSIGAYALGENTELTSVVIPDSITTIYHDAFYQCTALTNIMIGCGVSNMYGQVFSNCTELANVTFMGECPNGVSQSGVFDYATKVRCRKRFADSYAQAIPQEIFAGYVLIDDDEWLNILGQSFTKDGVADWFGDYDVSHDGEGAMRSGAIGNEQSSWIETKVNGPVRLSFWWKASSEGYAGEVFDYAYLSVDGEPKGSLDEYQLTGVAIGGKTEWTKVVYDIMDEGEHTVRWTYTKDEIDESDVGDDSVWLDEVSLDPLVSLSFALNGGEGATPETISEFAQAEVALPTTTGFCKPKHTFIGWNDGADTYAGGAKYVAPSSNVMFTAVWRANTLSAPVIISEDVMDGGVLNGASATISITAEKGTEIHYTLDGSEPTAASALYYGPFVVDGLSAAVRAIAIRNDYFDSDVTAFSFSRQPVGLADCINATGRAVTTNGVAGWTCVFGDAAHDGVAALRSGVIGDSESSVVEMTVLGAGEISFWWKSSSEISRNRKYDYVSFLIDNEEASWLGGEKDWTNETFSVVGDGLHSLKWVYQKNDNGLTQGEDCAWIDEVTWTSTDPLPDVAGDAEVGAVLTGAGDEVRLKAKLDAAPAYRQFRNWVDANGITHQAAKDSPNAWLSYALDAPGLMAKATPIVSADVSIDAIMPSDDVSGAFDLLVGIANVEIGTAANLAEVFGIEGATELDEAAFSSDGLSVTLRRTDGGKAKATVMPDGVPPTFFLRVKVK